MNIQLNRLTRPANGFIYEQVLQVPNYVIFEPYSGELEVYTLDDSGQYKLESPYVNERYFIPQLNLFLGVWEGIRENRQGYWLRWWDEQGELLLWGFERVIQETQKAEQERQRAEQESQRAEQEHQRAERLLAQLRAAGIEPQE